MCRVLEGEGVRVKRPEVIDWPKLETFRTPTFESKGTMNACVRDGFMVVGDEIIESAMSWRSRMFENHAYKKLFTDYFRRGARWTCAPYPAMGDDLYNKNYPIDDHEARERMQAEGAGLLTEAEIAFDAADSVRFGNDIFLCLTQTTNRSGVEWLKKHLEPKGIRVHSLIFKESNAIHADSTFVPLKPGVMMVHPYRDCLKINDVPTNKWDWFTNRGWKIYVAPNPVFLRDTYYVSKWIHMNVLSIDEERVLMQKGEESMKKLFLKLGMKPIEVDISHCNELGGAFHCWTLDVKRRGKLQCYF